MGLSKHTEYNHSILKALQKLDKDTVMLDGKLVKPSTCYRLAGNPPAVIYNTNCPEDLMEKIESILQEHRNKMPDVNYFYTIEFDHQGIHYTGRLTPSFKKGRDEPASWHVVLNEVFFGHLYKDKEHWEISEQRPEGLVAIVGRLIDERIYRVTAM